MTKRWSIVILAVCVVVAVAILAWRRYDLPWAAALAEYLLAVITAIVAIVTLARRFASHSGPIDLDEWENVLRERMRELWIEGRGAPLQAAERDSPFGLQNLSFMKVPELLHPSRRGNSAAARSFSLHDNLTPGQLFTQHNESMLVVGAPGSGKSVLLWQILHDLLVADGGQDVRVPVFIELHRWSTMDNVNKSERDFQDFIAHELAAPAIGLPKKVTHQLVARNRLTYLLDGLDELPGEYGACCLFALSKFARGPGEKPRRRVALTCREDDYSRLKEERYPSGTDAVLHALRITPLPERVIDKALAAGPVRSRLSKAAESVPALEAMLGIPLWLSIAEEVYRRASERANPLESLEDGDDASRIQSDLFAQWLDQRLDPESLERRQLEFLASMMQANGQQTLYLEVLVPAWLRPVGWERAAERLAGLVAVVPAGLVVGAGFGLLVTTAFGRTAGMMFGLATGLAVGVRLWQTVRRHVKEPNVVAERRWLWREALSRQKFRAELGAGLRQGLAFGLYLGLTLGVAFAVAVWLTVGPSVDLTDLPSFGRAAGEALRELLGDLVVEMILVVSLLVSLVALGAVGGTAIGLVGGVTLALVVGGWVPEPAIVGRSSRPSEALLNSTVQGLVTGLVSGLAVGLISGVTFGLTNGLGLGVIVGLTVGSVCGWAYGLVHGLAAPIAHASTRMTAVVHGVLPLKLVSFLRNASKNGIMYPVGPGFRFRHRTLAEHLATTATARRG